MVILSIRSDKPEAEIGLFQDGQRLAYETWLAHRQLAESLHQRILDLLKRHGKGWHDIQGIACYQGPGSFTGLRIGLSVANALAYSLDVPIVAAQNQSQEAAARAEAGRYNSDEPLQNSPEAAWLRVAISRLQDGQNDQLALPEYGADVHVTAPKH